MTDQYDAALGWLEVAAEAIDRARECIRVGAQQATDRIAEGERAAAADLALKHALWDVVEDMTRVRIAQIIHDRLRAERERLTGAPPVA